MHSWRLLRRALPFTMVLVLLGAVLVTNARATLDAQDGAAAKPAVVHEQDVPRAPAATTKQPTAKTKTSRPAVVAQLPETTVRSFSMLGVTWDPDARSADLAVEVRWRHDGRWSSWTPLDLELGPDVEGGRPGTEPQWTDASDGVAVRVTSTSGHKPSGLRVAMIDPGAGADVRPVAATVGQPAIIMRSQWGASAGGTCSSPVYGATTLGAVIHHTAGSNTYTKAQSASIVKATQAYHINSRDWCDIGYNFLVDKYGQIFEGRKGGITKPVRAAHSGNDPVNQETMGVSLMGTFTSTEPTAAMKDSVAKLVAWRFALYNRPAKGTYSLGGKTLNRIAGHRNVVSTECPGAKVYAWLSASGGLRDSVEKILAGGTTTQPSPIAQLAAQLGPEKTGALVKAEYGSDRERRANYEKVDIMWAEGFGTHYVAGTFRTEWLRLGSSAGQLDFITSNQLSTSDPNVTVQRFKNGSIYRVKSPDRFDAYGLWGPIAEKYKASDEAGGVLGAPRSSIDEVKPGVLKATFDKGFIQLDVATGTVTQELTGTSSTPTDSVTVPSSRSIALKGHGYGHGIGMSQYGAQSAAGGWRQLTYDKILAYYYPGTALATKTANLRVLISKDTSSDVVVKDSGSMTVRDVSAAKTTTLSSTYGGTAVSEWRIVVRSAKPSESWLQYRYSGGAWKRYPNLTFKGSAYFKRPGALKLVLPGGSVARYWGEMWSVKPSSTSTTRDTINKVSLEYYARGVVPREMPSSWRAEALKAQAVAARTYALRTSNASRYYDVCDTTSCQVYGGVDDETSATNAAVAGTKGKIVTYDGKPALTQFSSSSGGRSAAGSEPYLKDKLDTFDLESENANLNWSVSVAASKLEKAYPSIGTLRSLAVTKRTGYGDFGGRVVSLKLVGSKGSTTISGSTARSVMGLKSTWFAFD
ncbi:SpoIID/LytB domain-containing protein [Aeromicrobium terrae]|uniref:SpoIID/LytB domain-containing protein n=1 Tax=Aeromicrobium terrae TaxID=2498846 RepID=A0A5C8NEL2_9ACTN|nr:SpoIID/LytB domain-containing protein [Aeromicrobium terrae]TXL57313.1 SpoIID/LytB domain-containing protein [Aeromicrobium terrae]